MPDSWPTSEPYLILHKVRGEPAFDVAVQLHVKCESDPGPWWVIPTSGHRAYPLRWWRLDDLRDISDINHAGFHDAPTHHDDEDLSSLRDHYAAELTPIVPLNLSFASKTPMDRRF